MKQTMNNNCIRTSTLFLMFFIATSFQKTTCAETQKHITATEHIIEYVILNEPCAEYPNVNAWHTSLSTKDLAAMHCVSNAWNAVSKIIIDNPRNETIKNHPNISNIFAKTLLFNKYGQACCIASNGKDSLQVIVIDADSLVTQHNVYNKNSDIQSCLKNRSIAAIDTPYSDGKSQENTASAFHIKLSDNSYLVIPDGKKTQIIHCFNKKNDRHYADQRYAEIYTALIEHNALNLCPLALKEYAENHGVQEIGYFAYNSCTRFYINPFGTIYSHWENGHGSMTPFLLPMSTQTVMHYDKQSLLEAAQSHALKWHKIGDRVLYSLISTQPNKLYYFIFDNHRGITQRSIKVEQSEEIKHGQSITVGSYENSVLMIVLMIHNSIKNSTNFWFLDYTKSDCKPLPVYNYSSLKNLKDGFLAVLNYNHSCILQVPENAVNPFIEHLKQDTINHRGDYVTTFKSNWSPNSGKNPFQ